MLKMKVTLGAAIIASSLTIIVGLPENLGVLTLGYRALISALVFAAGGYLVGHVIEARLERLLKDDVQIKGQNIDITSEETPMPAVEPVETADGDQSFSPLTHNDFAQVSVKQQ